MISIYVYMLVEINECVRCEVEVSRQLLRTRKEKLQSSSQNLHDIAEGLFISPHAVCGQYDRCWSSGSHSRAHLASSDHPGVKVARPEDPEVAMGDLLHLMSWRPSGWGSPLSPG